MGMANGILNSKEQLPGNSFANAFIEQNKEINRYAIEEPIKR